MKLNVFCDFDGTITETDTTDAILEAFAAPEYREWEALWEHGYITGRQCMERQTRLIKARPESLELVCQYLAIDQGIYELAAACLRNCCPLTIVSDGIDALMEAVLKARGLARIPHFSNALNWDARGAPFLTFPFRDPKCAGGCGLCKCKFLTRGPREIPTVYIGDGLSDACVINRADRVFAKNRLLSYCAQRGIRHEPFADLSQVAKLLFQDPCGNHVARSGL